jgi:hypothetical protein
LVGITLNNYSKSIANGRPIDAPIKSHLTGPETMQANASASTRHPPCSPGTHSQGHGGMGLEKHEEQQKSETNQSKSQKKLQ